MLISETADFSSCLFHDCKAPDYDGGAILVTASGITLQITKSSFSKCKAPMGHGGAISFQSENLYLKNVCFANCDCDNSGQAVDAIASTDKNLYLEGSNVDSCAATLSSDEGVGAIYFFQGQHRSIESNFTNNRVVTASSFNTDDSVSCIITYSNFANNAGNILLRIEDVRHNDDLSFINVISNKCLSEETYGLIYISTNSKLRDSIFKDNSRNLVQADVSVTLTFVDCTFDGSLQANVTGKAAVNFDGCSTSSNPKTMKFSPFDQRYCWMIDPPKLAAGPSTYWFFLVFFVFVGFVGYTTFLSFRRVMGLSQPSSLTASSDYNKI